MQAFALPGVYGWAAWQPDRDIFFWSYFFVRDGGNVVVDPLPLSDQDAAEIEKLGGVQTVIITNRDHVRDVENIRRRFGARVVASGTEAPLLGIDVDATFDDGTEVCPGIRAVALEGAKTPGEVALVIPSMRAVLFGDAVIGKPAGALSLLPDEKLADAGALLRSLRRVWAYRPDALLLGDGAPAPSGGDALLGALLELRGGPAINRINLDELRFEPFSDAGGRYAGEDAEVGFLIGARKLGYRFARVAPGARYCPMHAHDKEEEMFFVIEGKPSIRTTRGTVELRAGDVIAFPTGERGTHQLLNESDKPCLLLLLGMSDPDEVCYYPDSGKILIERHDLIVATEPVLDYYHGEE